MAECVEEMLLTTETINQKLNVDCAVVHEDGRTVVLADLDAGVGTVLRCRWNWYIHCSTVPAAARRNKTD